MRTNFCFGGRDDRQRTPAIRIAAITLASDSAITIARFRPSKERSHISKAHEVLKPLCTAGCSWNEPPAPPPGQKALLCQGFYDKPEDIPGTPAGRLLFLPPMSPRFPGLPRRKSAWESLGSQRWNWRGMPTILGEGLLFLGGLQHWRNKA